MNTLHAIILGLIQGLTEFLPVSSSGHLVFFQNLFGLEGASLSFDVLLHLGTLAAVLTVYRQKIAALIKKPFQRTTYLLIAGTIPTVIIALLFKDSIEAAFVGGGFLGINFIITGIVLFFTSMKKPGVKKIRNMSYLDAFVVGTLQGVATFPAISRSGMTICGGLFRGLDRENAAEYSFLLSIIATLGAVVLEIKDMFDVGATATSSLGIGPMIVGFFVAAISGYAAIRFFLNILNKGKLKIFAVYVFCLGAFIILDSNVLHLVFKA